MNTIRQQVLHTSKEAQQANVIGANRAVSQENWSRKVTYEWKSCNRLQMENSNSEITSKCPMTKD